MCSIEWWPWVTFDPDFKVTVLLKVHISKTVRVRNKFLSLFVLTAIFQVNLGSVSQCLLKQRMMEVVVTTGLLEQSFLQTGCPSCRSTNSVKALKGKYHIPRNGSPQAHLGVFQLGLWPITARGYLGEGCHASHQPSDASTPSIEH